MTQLNNDLSCRNENVISAPQIEGNVIAGNNLLPCITFYNCIGWSSVHPANNLQQICHGNTIVSRIKRRNENWFPGSGNYSPKVSRYLEYVNHIIECIGAKHDIDTYNPWYDKVFDLKENITFLKAVLSCTVISREKTFLVQALQFTLTFHAWIPIRLAQNKF